MLQEDENIRKREDTNARERYKRMRIRENTENLRILDANNIIVVPSNRRECCERTRMQQNAARGRESEDPREGTVGEGGGRGRCKRTVNIHPLFLGTISEFERSACPT